MRKKYLICNKNFDKKEIKNLIEWFLKNYGTIRTCKLLNELKLIGFHNATKAGISLGPEDLNIPITKKEIIKNIEKEINKNKYKLYKGKINKIEHLQKVVELWNITSEILKNEIIKNFRQKNLLNPVYMMIFSGARGNISQIKQIIGMRGLMSDSKGEIIKLPIKSNLKEGLNATEYFISCYGARKGLIDTALKTANSGYLTRRLIYVSQNIIIKQPDCKTKTARIIKCKTKNKKEYIETKEKIIGRILAEDIRIKKITIANKGQDICNYISKKIIKEKKYIAIRSPLNCKLNIGLCQLCYGWNLSTNKITKMGETVGILAAQSIGEPGTQLTMRTFHTGGIFTSEISKVIISPHEGEILYSKTKNERKVLSKYGEKAILTLKEKNIFIKKNEIITSKIKIPKYSILFLKRRKNVFKKQIIGEIPEWKKIKIKSTLKKSKNIKEIKSNFCGQIYLSINSQNIKETLWIIKNNIIKYESLLENTLTKKHKSIRFFLKKKNIRRKKNEKKSIVYCKINYKNIIKIKNHKIYKEKIKKTKSYEIKTNAEKRKKLLISSTKNKKLLKIKQKNKKIKIEKFIKPKRNKDIFGQINELRKNIIEIKKGKNYLIPKNSIIKIKNNNLIEKNNTIFKIIYETEKTRDIVEGLPKIEEILEVKKKKNLQSIKKNPQERIKKQFSIYKEKYKSLPIASEKTIKNIQIFLINQIQSVYKSQQVNISEKHIEIIVKQMTSRVIIKNPGDSNLIIGEIIEFNKIKMINQTLKNKITYEPILLGISKISLLSESFISAACFQETTRILTRAAIMGKIDWLNGLKENIILGNLIPAGTAIKTVL